MIFGKHVNKYYLKYSWALLIGIAALLIVDFAQLMIPEIYGAIIGALDKNAGGTGLTLELLQSLCLKMFIVIIVLVSGRFIWRICFYGSAVKVETDLRGEMFQHCKDLSQSFYSKNKVGNMMSLFTNDIETINECFGDGILMFFDATGLGLLSIIKMFKIDSQLTLFSLIPLAFMAVIGIIVSKYMMQKWQIRQQAFSELSDFAQESFSGMSVIKAFVKEFKELWAFKKINKNNENANVTFVKASTLLQVTVMLFVNSVLCVILGLGGYYAVIGKMNSEELVEFIGYFSSVIWPIMAIARLIDMHARGKASLNRISDLLDTKIDVIDRDDVLQDVKEIKGKIEFKNLTFRYPESDYDSLSNISFKIEAGENIGIIGKTGAGKTTIVDLILRTYNVPDNTIFIDDYDINKLPIKLVRDNAAYVPQDNFLFSDTIERNIAFAFQGQANHAEIEKVATLADLDENIKLFKDGYNTMLGERGVTISGGQKQRTSIARALIKDASILILDDSVSAVDTKTEKIILDNLKATRKGKTTILIAHRISTIEKMDKILFVDDGKIIDFGTHDYLIKHCKEYANMVELQRLEDEYGGDSNE